MLSLGTATRRVDRFGQSGRAVRIPAASTSGDLVRGALTGPKRVTSPFCHQPVRTARRLLGLVAIDPKAGWANSLMHVTVKTPDPNAPPKVKKSGRHKLEPAPEPSTAL